MSNCFETDLKSVPLHSSVYWSGSISAPASKTNNTCESNRDMCFIALGIMVQCGYVRPCKSGKYEHVINRPQESCWCMWYTPRVLHTQQLPRTLCNLCHSWLPSTNHRPRKDWQSTLANYTWATTLGVGSLEDKAWKERVMSYNFSRPLIGGSQETAVQWDRNNWRLTPQTQNVEVLTIDINTQTISEENTFGLPGLHFSFHISL